ncbi:hypothetical protein FACS1894147_04060 [Spirochaetia bacterium]|nr:hypothetical protein FACS1894147_04060 [Spirochaetia bacterium]
MKKIMLAMLVVGFLVNGLTGCASGPSDGTGEIVYREVRDSRPLYKEPYKGYVLHGYIRQEDDGNWVTFRQGDVIIFVVSEELAPLFAERVRYTPNTSGAATIPSAFFTLYLSVQPDDPANPNGPQHYQLDKIDGLISFEEASQIVEARTAKTQQEQKATQAARAQREAAQKAEEEANRYDPAKFIIVPSGFKPANYSRADLLTAAATAEKLKTIDLVENASSVELEDIIEERGLFTRDVSYTPSKKFASDVIFVSQNGTDISFKTSDNAITKMMKVDSRTGLTAGQKVRIYYRVYRIEGWQVQAIERL